VALLDLYYHQHVDYFCPILNKFFKPMLQVKKECQYMTCFISLLFPFICQELTMTLCFIVAKFFYREVFFNVASEESNVFFHIFCHI
jgi:hypothetical protein